ADLATVVREPIFGQSPLEIGARVNARRRVRLEKNEIAVLISTPPAEEMVESHLENFCGGSVARDVAAELSIGFVGTHHHGERVPSDDRCDALLELDVSWVGCLGDEWDRVLV